MSDTATEVPWGYSANDGPACWASLDPAFRLCGCGREQSPINLVNARTQQLPSLHFDYHPTTAGIVDTGRTIEFHPPSGHTLMVGSRRHELRQFHFHHASEHRIDGRHLPMELHLVHTDGDGALTVVGVLIARGDENAAVASLWQALVEDPDSLGSVNVDLAALLPASTKAWRYQGSLTTPPCSEGVSWIVLAGMLTLSARQIAAFANYHPANCRPVQPLGGRVLVIG
ncbi:MAG: carbonic anhydrase family protein [Alphaproteobacteria bacterium]|nr:carbonic anhydrase family protein [Alphaproteobacteria bacterium]